MAETRRREIEVHCSEPGCTRMTKASAGPVDARGGYEFEDPKEKGWVRSQRGMPTAGGLTWVYGTCPEHATKKPKP
jgi:hypothetical protein